MAGYGQALFGQEQHNAAVVALQKRSQTGDEKIGERGQAGCLLIVSKKT
jgi:hypothetical protein